MAGSTLAIKTPVKPWFTAASGTSSWNRLHLSPRQADVVQLMLRGLRDKQIAHCLGIQVSTIRMHLRQVFTRLGVQDRMELALRVFIILRQNETRRSHPPE
ncbi:MAG: LuxR C-terminal-related transcriptional regulator [Myxococcales bacterium]